MVNLIVNPVDNCGNGLMLMSPQTIISSGWRQKRRGPHQPSTGLHHHPYDSSHGSVRHHSDN